ncbi:helix-turn-helix domain-containing protein [Knoellia sp. CPCC 206450]|uniref:helix-turn-helix domain-containing protein n=1 Tax=Knoellia tibetensis TaxID=3404798 RepID=UPI003B42F9A3
MSTTTVWTVPEWTQGDRLRKARAKTGLSTKQFAELLGVSHGTVNNAECDRKRPRPVMLKAWAMATGVPVEWLENGTTPQGDPDGGGWAPWGSNPQPTD